jgi:hypothetical protein
MNVLYHVMKVPNIKIDVVFYICGAVAQCSAICISGAVAKCSAIFIWGAVA